MAHEHILIWLAPTPAQPPPDGPIGLFSVADQTTFIKDYVNAGGSALVSMSNHGLRGDAPGVVPPLPFTNLVKQMQKIATDSGASIILGTGYYKYEWQSAATQALSITELYQTIINDIFTGVDGVNAGIIGEIGLSTTANPPTSMDVTLQWFEWKSLIAACYAVIATGMSMNLHTDIGMLPAQRMLILDICEQLNVPLSRVIVSHLDPSQLLEGCGQDLATAAEVMTRGANCCFDLIAHNGFGSEGGDPQAATGIASLITQGFVNQIVLSQDLYEAAPLFFQPGADSITYAYMSQQFEPMLLNAQVTSADITQMRATNPQNLFTVGSPTTPAQPIVLTNLPGIVTTPPVTLGPLANNLLIFGGGSLSIAVPPAIQPTIPFTISVFVQAATAPTGTVSIVDCSLVAGVIGTNWPQVAGSGWALSLSTAGAVFSVGTGGDGQGDGTIITTNGAANVFDGKWHNIIGVSDGDFLTVYMDGVAGTPVSIGPSIPVTTTGNLTVGAGGGLGVFIGSMQSLTFYPSALTATQIAAIIAAGPGATAVAAEVSPPLSAQQKES